MGRLLIVNPRSGNQDASVRGRVLDVAREHGWTARVLRDREDAAEVARSSHADVLGVAGGDGSLAGVAGVAIERGCSFACVPLGTRNHFARDLSLDPTDPVAVLTALSSRLERRVDVGRVHERIFLNNVSLGLYARFVHRRERDLRGKALASARALAQAVRLRRRRWSVDGEPVNARVVVVANNAYRLHVSSLGVRPRLDTGFLHVYLGRGFLPISWEEHACKRVVLDADGREVPAAIDGEPIQLRTPLRFEIEPRALRVLVPR